MKLNPQALRNSLLIMERAIVGNTYEKKLIEFRNVVDAAEEEAKRVKDRMAAAALVPSGENEGSEVGENQFDENGMWLCVLFSWLVDSLNQVFLNREM